MMDKILLPESIDAAGTEFLKRHGYQLIYGSGNPEITQADLAGCDAVITRNARITREMMLAAPDLKVIARHGVGVDLIDVNAARELGIWVTNAPESNTVSVAEQVIGAMLAVARRFNACRGLIHHNDYGMRTRICGMELAGRTLGIVGFGRIGRCVAKKAALGLDMKIVVYDPYGKEFPSEYHVDRAQCLDELLKISDVVTLHVPLTEETWHMIGKEQFDRMKQESILINYARGALIDWAALTNALECGQIGGAALDVFEQEPVMGNDPICQFEQVLLTPHTASFTKRSLENMALHAALTVHQVLSGAEPSWYVARGCRGIWKNAALDKGI